jgi:hypothetical protein
MTVIIDTLFGRIPHHEVIDHAIDSTMRALMGNEKWCYVGLVFFGLVFLFGIVGLNLFFKEKK